MIKHSPPVLQWIVTQQNLTIKNKTCSTYHRVNLYIHYCSKSITTPIRFRTPNSDNKNSVSEPQPWLVEVPTHRRTHRPIQPKRSQILGTSSKAFNSAHRMPQHATLWPLSLSVSVYLCLCLYACLSTMP